MTNEPITLMQPLMPPRQKRELDDLVVKLIETSSQVAAQLPKPVQDQVGNLVRSMNCYYSNLIEGHHTHPRDIERALDENFSTQKEKRDLQLEAKAHIEVQTMIDKGELPFSALTTEAVLWIHEQFYIRLPDDLRWVTNPDTGKEIEVIPGKLREDDVVVGRHVPPKHLNLKAFMTAFDEAYDFSTLSRIEQILAIAAAHHRLLWIHPFADGNGRVTRLISHAAFKETGIGTSLWSVARGLARQANDYKLKLDGADHPRQGDTDGRGSLSENNLIEFCCFFLETALDQVKYMSQLLDMPHLLDRVEQFAEEQIKQKKLPKGSHIILKEAFLKGKVDRGKIAGLTGYSERQGRSIIAALTKQGLLGSDRSYGPLTVRFPHYVTEVYFPQLYPALEA